MAPWLVRRAWDLGCPSWTGYVSIVLLGACFPSLFLSSLLRWGPSRSSIGVTLLQQLVVGFFGFISIWCIGLEKKGRRRKAWAWLLLSFVAAVNMAALFACIEHDEWQTSCGKFGWSDGGCGAWNTGRLLYMMWSFLSFWIFLFWNQSCMPRSKVFRGLVISSSIWCTFHQLSIPFCIIVPLMRGLGGRGALGMFVLPLFASAWALVESSWVGRKPENWERVWISFGFHERDVEECGDRPVRMSPLPPPAEKQATISMIQLTDIHLAPSMPVDAVRKVCASVVDLSPDLVLLTGDFLTPPSKYSPLHLAEALQPLRELKGRVFACTGNHDVEPLACIQEAFKECDIVLLRDAAARVTIGECVVQVVGIDWLPATVEHVVDVSTRLCFEFNADLCVVLLHDPFLFQYVAKKGVLVLSGHTHGGTLGNISCGGQCTIVGKAMRAPDVGLWRNGSNLLYVNRGLGTGTFVNQRLGVPPEESVLLFCRKGVEP